MEDKIFKRKEHRALWECKLMQPLGKTVRMFLRKLKLGLPHDPAGPLLSIYPKEMKMGHGRGLQSSMTAALRTTVRR